MVSRLTRSASLRYRSVSLKALAPLEKGTNPCRTAGHFPQGSQDDRGFGRIEVQQFHKLRHGFGNRQAVGFLPVGVYPPDQHGQALLPGGGKGRMGRRNMV